MHRFLRPLTHQRHLPSQRSLASRFRHPYRHATTQTLYRPTGEAVRFQTVRFKKPGIFSLRSLARYLLYTGATAGCFILILRYFDVEIEFVEEEELGQGQDRKQGTEAQGKAGEEAEGEGPFYADEDSLFIPLTWSKKSPRTYYRGSDPEWQEFIKVARDKDRSKKIQADLVRLVGSECGKDPRVRQTVGKDISIGKYWMDTTFPDGPPPEYERSGIEIGDDFIAWSQQKVPPESQWRVLRALWPMAAAQGVWAATSTLVGIQYRRVKQALGWEGRDSQSPEERYRQMLEIMQKHREQAQGRNGQVNAAQAALDANRADVTASRTPTPDSTDAQKRFWYIPVHLPNGRTDSKENKSATTDIPVAMHTFRQTLSKAWNPKGFEPPRGTFVVQGLVEIHGSRGRMLLDVLSAYDPRVGKFVRVIVGLRNFKKHKQAPRGGP